MKYLVFVLPLLLAGCASRSGTTVEHAQSQKLENPAGAPTVTSLTSKAEARLEWEKIKNLTGEPLVASLIPDDDVYFGEIKERRRNARLAIAALALESKIDPDENGLDQQLTRELQEEALNRKMALWKAVQKK